MHNSVDEEISSVSGYKYDVFFSYKRHELIVDWVAGIEKRIRFWLAEELGGKSPSVFFDKETIEVGDLWPDTIRQALQTSKCMIAIWSPSYFQSKWCTSEWRSFLEREKQIGNIKAGLVAPIKYHDGQYFHPDAQNVQQYDLSGYTSTLEVFWETKLAVELDGKLKVFAQRVAKMVKMAPPFDANWAIEEHTPILPPQNIPLNRL